MVVVDDEELLCRLVSRVLSHHGYDVWTAQDAENGLQLIVQRRPHVLLLDLHLGTQDGRHLLARARAELGECTPPHVFCSGDGEVEGQPTLRKPFALHELVEVVREASTGSRH